jgi:D-methionine transport system substrate-binding protein
MKKRLLALLVGTAFITGLAGCSKPAAEAPKTDDTATEGTAEETTEPVVLKVGASPTPHAEILNVAKDILANEGIDLQVIEFTDYIQPNLALDSGDLDANFFQHLPYLDDFNAKNGTKIVSLGTVHYEPMGIYAGKTTSLDAIPDGAKVAVPNDLTNEARALLLLEANGLITLNKDAGLSATKLDIVENPHNLDIVEIEAAQLARSVKDVDLSVINGNYAIQAGLQVDKDALAKEEDDSIAAETYANILAIREGEETRPELQKLIDVLHSQEITDYITSTYQGGVAPINK